MKPELLSALMERASQEEMGLAVETNNPQQLQQNLANHRRNHGLTQYENLLFTVPSKPNTVYITKRSVELDDA